MSKEEQEEKKLREGQHAGTGKAGETAGAKKLRKEEHGQKGD